MSTRAVLMIVCLATGVIWGVLIGDILWHHPGVFLVPDAAPAQLPLHFPFAMSVPLIEMVDCPNGHEPLVMGSPTMLVCP